MQSWHLPLLGRRRFTGRLSTFEIEQFFTYSWVERANILSRVNDRHRVALAVHIGFIRMTGRYLAAFDTIPAGVLRQIGQQLDPKVPDIASLRTLYQRSRTMEQHQLSAAHLLGFQKFTTHRRRALIKALRPAAYELPTLAKLVTFAKCWLYDRDILLPAHRTVLDMAREAIRLADAQMLKGVQLELGEETIARWETVVFSEHEGESLLQWLQQSPSSGMAGLQEQIKRIDYLKSLNVDRYQLAAVQPERQEYLARSMRHRKPSRFRALRQSRRVLETACFLRVNLLKSTDTALDLAIHLSQQLHARAMARVRDAQTHSATEYRDILRAVRHAIQDTTLSDGATLEQIAALIPSERELSGTRAAAVRWELAHQTTSVRRIRRLLLRIDYHAAAGSALEEAIAVMRECDQQLGRRRLPAHADASFAPRWAHIIHADNRELALRGYEAALLFAIRQSLRNGSLWVQHSLKYRHRNDILMSEDKWQARRQSFIRQAGLPSSASSYVSKITAHVAAALEAVDDAVRTGELRVDHRGIHVPSMVAEERSDDVDPIAREIFSSIGSVQLPDIMAAIDNETRFSWSLLGREPTSEQEVLCLYAGLLGHGTELDALGVSLMIPSLNQEQVGNAMRQLEDAANVREANDRVLKFQKRHAVVKQWGAGVSASSDAMTIDATRRLWNARVDPKRRRHGIALYTHVLDQWGIVYDQPIVVTQRQAGVAIEGVVRQDRDTATRIERLAVDTHGYTDFGMAMARILGFDLCPRLKSLRDRKLHVPRGMAIPDSLKAVVRTDVSLRNFEVGWDELLRVCASVDSGDISAVLALERFGSDAGADPAFKAGQALGQLLRTLYLCDYFSNTDFRREVLRILHHGESMHTLQRTIHFGGIAAARARRHEELLAVSGSLTLLCNLVIAWNTSEIQRVLDQWRKQGRQVSGEVLRHIAPARSRGINMRGTMVFPIEHYRERLIPGLLER